MKSEGGRRQPVSDQDQGLSPEARQQLRALCEAATPGPWEHLEASDAVWSADDDELIAETPDQVADAAYIAAAHPGVVLRLLAEVERLEQAQTWQPIATAPTDGTIVLLCTAGWHKCEEGWFEGDGWHTDWNYIDPTHWLPLPAPPAPPQGEEGS